MRKQQIKEEGFATDMGPPDFCAYHWPSLASDAVKHGLLLFILTRTGERGSGAFLHWTLGEPGQCAVKMGRHSIVLKALDETQCWKLANITTTSNYPGVVGPDLTAKWFTDRATELGVRFLDPIPPTDSIIERQAPISGGVGICASRQGRGCTALR